MAKTVINFMIRFVLLILAQVVIFNNIVLFNVAVAFVFIYLIVSMPITWLTNVSVVLGFITGLCVDIFSDTPGLNALSCTILAFVRKPVFHLYMQRDEDLSGFRPSQLTMGSAPYLKYLITMTLIYCVTVFSVDAFSLFNPLRLIVCIVSSTTFTFIIIYAIDSISSRRNEKRL